MNKHPGSSVTDSAIKVTGSGFATTAISLAVAALKSGRLVAFPTETVYGLGADASNREAVDRIFAAKGRPILHPLIVHLSASDELCKWARHPPEDALKLAQHFWPGPLTLVLKKSEEVLSSVCGGQDTVALRMPRHDLALQLLRAFGGGIAGPSANPYGYISPTTVEHVRSGLGDRVEVILDGGECEVGIESTILDLSGARPRLLRPGHISREALENVLRQKIGGEDETAPRVPGMMARHYAPRTPVILLDENVWAKNLARYPHGFILGLAGQTPTEYARSLYARLRLADDSGNTPILVEMPPQTGEWAAVRDRLMRAAAR